jgi:hypothetical protein
MRKCLIAAALAVFGAYTAGATVILTAGNVGGQTENVLLSSGATGNLVTGTINGVTGFVNFNSTQILSEPSSGQARVEASSGALNNLTISLSSGFGFQTLIFNPFVGSTVGSTGTGTITVLASEPGAANQTFTFSNVALASGNNFVTLSASGGEAILSAAFSATPGVTDIRQVRLSGAAPIQGEPPAGVPEPATYACLASGLIAFGAFRRKRA